MKTIPMSANVYDKAKFALLGAAIYLISTGAYQLHGASTEFELMKGAIMVAAGILALGFYRLCKLKNE